MGKIINWKPYLFFILITIITSLFFKWEISLGLFVGTVVYYINLFLSSKKFPRLDSKTIVVSTVLLVIFLEGIFTFGAAVGLYFIGGLAASLAAFVALIIPNIYFFIVGSIK